MNENILLVMRYLDGKNSVTEEELKANKASAYAYADYASAVVAYASAAANAASNAPNAATMALSADRATHWVGMYFEETGEDRAEYDAEVIRLRTVK